jgi:branched-chain amino acid transport system ATP-binding protein
MKANPPLLEVAHLNAFYSTSQIIFDLSLGVDAGEIVVVLGRNGMGKTTLLYSVSNLGPRVAGRIMLAGEEVKGLPSYKLVRKGLGLVPSGRRIFPTLTVLQNLTVPYRSGGPRGSKKWTVETIFSLFPPLEPLKNKLAWQLSGGEQQMLTIGRSLVTNPKILLLDEPSEGLAPIILPRLAAAMNEIVQEGVAILMAEQNIQFALDLCQRGYVLEKGQIALSGSKEELRSHPDFLTLLSV